MLLIESTVLVVICEADKSFLSGASALKSSLLNLASKKRKTKIVTDLKGARKPRVKGKWVFLKAKAEKP